MNRMGTGIAAIVALLIALAPIGGCKSEPPPPEEPDLGSLRDKLQVTKQEMAEAHAKMKQAADKAKAERLAKERAKMAEPAEGRADAGTAPEVAPGDEKP